MKIEFDYIKFSKWIGWIIIFIAFIMAINVVVLEFTGNGTAGLLRFAIEYLLYGVIIVGISKMITYQERQYLEMKYFRRHYIERDKKKEEEKDD